MIVRCCAILTLLLAASQAWATPSDPYYNPYQIPYESKLGLPTAWGYSTGSSSVVVAVVDTGVVTTTPELASRLLTALSTVHDQQGQIVVPFDNATLVGNSVLRHGTYMAGTIGMALDNGVAGAGIGNFSILPITATDNLGHNSSVEVGDAIRLAADCGAKVINVSLSIFDYNELNAAAAYARTKGALTFVAAGNSNSLISGLTGYTSLIFVGGVDGNDNHWIGSNGISGSNYGPFINLSAPADHILTTNATLSTDPLLLSNYVQVDGTSSASALASGAAALAFSINPNLTPDQVLSLMYSTADEPTGGSIPSGASYTDVYGAGRLDVGRLAAAAVATVPEPSSLALLAGGIIFLPLVVKARRRRAKSV